MDTTFAATREDQRRPEKTGEDQRRPEKTMDEQGSGIPNNTGNATKSIKSDTSEEKKSKIYAPKASFPCEMENEKDTQKENKEIKLKKNVKNKFKLKLPNKTGNTDLFIVTNPKELNAESKKDINETKKSCKNIKTVEDESAKEPEIISYNIKVEKKEVHKKIKKVIILILILIILILHIQFNLILNNNLNKSNEIKKKLNIILYILNQQ